MNTALTTPPASRTPFKILPLESLLTTQLTPKEDLISPWLNNGESVMLWSAPATGKTFLSLTLALMVAGGGSCFGWESPKARKVLLIDGEMSIRDLQERLKGLQSAVKGLDVEKAGHNLHILARQHQSPESTFIDLADEQSQMAVLKLATDFKADLIILDNFSVLTEIEDENSAAAMSPVLNFLLRMKQAGIATILVHHSNKSGSDYRGSSKLAATFESIIGLRKTSEAVINRGIGFSLVWTKYRGRMTESTQPIKAQLVHTQDGLQWRFEVSEDAKLVDMVARVESCDYGTQDQLAEAMNVSKGTITKWRRKAIAKEMITANAWNRYLAAGLE